MLINQLCSVVLITKLNYVKVHSMVNTYLEVQCISIEYSNVVLFIFFSNACFFIANVYFCFR